MGSQTYLAAWFCLLAALGAAVYFGLFRGEPDAPIPAEELRPSDQAAPRTKEQSIDEQTRALKMSLGEAQITLNSGDGRLKMRMWAGSGEKLGAKYSIKDGVVEFALEEHETLLLKVTDAEYRMENDIAYVKGSLIGYLTPSEQYFSAEELAWNPSGNSVTAKRVEYSGEHIEVSGEQMEINLATGVVTFSGPVEAGI